MCFTHQRWNPVVFPIMKNSGTKRHDLSVATPTPKPNVERLHKIFQTQLYLTWFMHAKILGLITRDCTRIYKKTNRDKSITSQIMLAKDVGVS